MITIYVKKSSDYPVSAPKIKSALKAFLVEHGIVSDTIVDVAIVSEEKMLALAKEYLDEDNVLHNVLSFTATETKKPFVTPDDGVLRLGEIVVCFPKARDEANHEGVLIDEKVIELVNHGALHLLGIHHD